MASKAIAVFATLLCLVLCCFIVFQERKINDLKWELETGEQYLINYLGGYYDYKKEGNFLVWEANKKKGYKEENWKDIQGQGSH